MRINRLRRRESITLLGCAVAVETRVTHPADAIRARKQSYYCTAANGSSKVPTKAASAKSHSMTSWAAGNQCGRQVEARDLAVTSDVNRSKRACAPFCCQTCQKMRTMVHIRLPLCLARSA